ncbi:MAG: hypothetical protein A3F46_00560 [Legionellales bacterium RIFCSPHIGHO2_12_FULL_42_9]|nr:MAG: hypothetical protein A3F46_00560 [Legionellales bacterium RIFCSPHIGHO2_12_FULL_42_9]
MYIKRLAVDLAKNVFQLFGVDNEKRIKSRKVFVEFVAKLGPCEIVIEACGGANYYLPHKLFLSRVWLLLTWPIRCLPNRQLPSRI